MKDPILEQLNEDSNRRHLAFLVQHDPHADEKTKQHILPYVDGAKPLKLLFAGTAGALAALTISRLLQCKKQTQILLSLAGFGAGVIIGNHLINNRHESPHHP